MSTTKVAITVDQEILRIVDRWVAQRKYPNRSQAIQAILKEKMIGWKRTRLIEELSKLNTKQERSLANEKMAGESWPEF